MIGGDVLLEIPRNHLDIFPERAKIDKGPVYFR